MSFTHHIARYQTHSQVPRLSRTVRTQSFIASQPPTTLPEIYYRRHTYEFGGGRIYMCEARPVLRCVPTVSLSCTMLGTWAGMRGASRAEFCVRRISLANLGRWNEGAGKLRAVQRAAATPRCPNLRAFIQVQICRGEKHIGYQRE